MTTSKALRMQRPEIVALVALFAGVLLSGGAARVDASPSWSSIAPTLVDQTGGAAAVAGGKIYVFGGLGKGSSVRSSVEAYDPKTKTWSKRRPMPIGRAWLSAATGPDGRIYTFGGLAIIRSGENLRAVALRKTEIYDPKTNAWSAGARMPVGGRSAAAAPAGGKIYVFGGFRQNYAPYGILATVQIYDPSSNTWTLGRTMPTPQLSPAAVPLNGRIYVFGGTYGSRPSHGGKNLDVYDPTTNTWKSGPGLLTTQQEPAGARYRGWVEAIGGFDKGSRVAAVEGYHAANGRWARSPALPHARAETMAASLHGVLYVIDGNVSGAGGAPHNGDTTSVIALQP